MRRVALLCLALVFCAAASLPTFAADKPAAGKKHRILMQWAEGDSMGQWIMTKHVENLLADLGPENVQLEVLAYGPATFAVTTRPNTKFAADIKRFTESGVEFRVCHHAMDLLGVKEDEVLPYVKPVQGAMSEIARKYSAGWQTLRP